VCFVRKKVSVIGAGQTGASTAQRIAERGYADVVLTDVVEGLAEGKALDLQESAPVLGFGGRVTGVTTTPEGNGYEATANSDVVVITSGVPRKPGMSRDDLLNVNFGIMKAVTEQVVKYSPNCIIVPVANPLDAMCQAVYRLSGFPRERVIGMAGVLDSARMRTFIAMEVNVSVENVHAFVLGGHGDTMVPLPRYSTIAGIPMPDYPYFKQHPERIEAICKRTADGGAEITKLVGTSAWYAPGAAAAEMVECILKDKKKILPCSVFLQGEYGVRDLFVGVPAKLGARGVEEIIQIALTPDEDAALKKSANAVKELVDVIKM
jgi:malate dehydrogenase